jgi:hypothetical protein
VATFERIEKETRWATMSLLLFGSLHALALAALFWMSPAPWNWRVGIALGACALAYVAAWLIWRTAHVGALVLGAVAVVGSLVRLLAPFEGGVGAAITIAVTLLFAIPIVRAIVVVSRP